MELALIAAAGLGFFVTLALCGLIEPPGRLLWAPDRAELPPSYLLPAVRAMGGLCAAAGSITAAGIGWAALCGRVPGTLGGEERLTERLLAVLSISFLCGMLGAAEDLTRLRRRQPAGVPAGQRRVLLTLTAAAAGMVLWRRGWLPLEGVLPVVGTVHWGYAGALAWLALLPLLLDCAQMSDRTDGVCAGTTLAGLGGLMCCAARTELAGLAVWPGALAGALLAFLLWNFAPARLRCGAVGSHFAAGSVWAFALVSGWPVLAVTAALPWLVQGGQLALQLLTRRVTGKRLFAAAPLDELLRQRGWNDAAICGAFYMLALAGLALSLWFTVWAVRL